MRKINNDKRSKWKNKSPGPTVGNKNFIGRLELKRNKYV